MNYEDKIKYIMGKTLHKISTSENSNNLELLLDNNEVITFYAEGECCSDSWIENFESPSKPEKIVSFEQIEIPPSLDYMDEVQYYFYKLNTDKGSYLIEMRNNSNGYYGGYLE